MSGRKKKKVGVGVVCLMIGCLVLWLDLVSAYCIATPTEDFEEEILDPMKRMEERKEAIDCSEGG